jgi:glycosyltransferase involved in cell wall biosynthesis
MPFTDALKYKNPKLNHINHIIVFSHLRWNFVYQRPQHLLTRFAADFNIVFIEEPIYDGSVEAYHEFSQIADYICKIVPHLPHDITAEEGIKVQKELLGQYLQGKNLADYAFWYYTPMALEISREYNPGLVIFDCMDELSAFKFAPESLKALERELLNKADIVFTGGNSLYQAKKHQHHNIHPFPSSIDVEHFKNAREITTSPADQLISTRPKLGFYGVIDERFDIDLIKGIAEAHDDWDIILIGPVVKIDPATLPQNENIYYLGSKTYQELPYFVATWDVALIPFLLNESTMFISPTKTPEYLAAGLPVISTAIKDVVDPYGISGLVHIGATVEDFIAAAEQELVLSDDSKKAWLAKVDSYLSQNSWNKTYQSMLKLLEQAPLSKTYSSVTTL